jgi:hypothetical protein
LQPANEKSGSSSKGFQGNSPIKNQYIFPKEFEKNLKNIFRKSWLKCKSPYLCTPFKKRVIKTTKVL